MDINEKVISRLDQLLAMGDKVLATKRELPPNYIGFDDMIDTQLAHQWSTSAQNLLVRTFGQESEHYRAFVENTKGGLTFSPVYRGQGILKAAKDDYENGYLFDVRQLISAELFDEFLEQAEHLLQNGYHQPAAVIAGAVLEDGLRKLCVKHGVELSSKPKLDGMNADLVKAGAYTKLQQKRITALADLRNNAAHGEWDRFTKEDVEDMLRSTRRFMEEHFA